MAQFVHFLIQLFSYLAMDSLPSSLLWESSKLEGVHLFSTVIYVLNNILVILSID